MANIGEMMSRIEDTIKKEGSEIGPSSPTALIVWLSTFPNAKLEPSLRQQANQEGKTPVLAIKQPWSPSRLAAMVGRGV
jgi:hypothetical protein